MSTPWSTQKFNETLAEIQKRSVTDSDFRALALKDPSAAVEAITGEPLPPGAKLRFVNQVEEITVVLPPPVGGELTEEQLEQVAGGTIFVVAGALGTAAVVGITVSINIDNCM